MASAHGGFATGRLHKWAHENPDKFRHMLNWYPCYRGTGGRVTHIAADWTEMHIEVPLNRRTKNYVGTIFGGSLYACIDPMFMFMLMHQLGGDYLVWDKGATIRFRKPGKSTLKAICKLPPGEADAVRKVLETEAKTDRKYTVELVDEGGTVHASIEKVVNVRKAT